MTMQRATDGLAVSYGAGVRKALSFEDLEAIERQRTPEAHRSAAAELLSWAEQRHPDDEVTPADLVSAAAWHLGRAGDTEPSLDLHRRAVAIGGLTSLDARCLLHAALLDAGQLDEARRVADDLRRSRPRIVDCAAMAENFDEAGDLRQAHRWVEMGVTQLQLDAPDTADDSGVMVLLNIRRTVRRELGFPPDELDEMRPE
jgi:hypothetical protein